MSNSYGAKKGYLDDYVTVASRLEGFHEKYPQGRIVTELIDREDGLICFKAHVYTDLDSAQPSATGHSIDSLDIQKSSFEKLETAAVGRALAFLGFGAKNISSAEEMERHESRQEPRTVGEYQKTQRTSSGVEMATEPQKKAIQSLCDKLKRDVNQYDLTSITKSWASQLIRELQKEANG
jgi:hypothetical protein